MALMPIYRFSKHEKIAIPILREMIINYDFYKDRNLAKSFGMLELRRICKRRDKELILEAKSLILECFDIYYKLSKIT